MGLSSQLAPSAIARPGVIANAAARPASPYDGQVIYQQDTDQAYVWNGSAWVLLSTGTANPPGLELVSSGSFSNAATVDVTGFTGSYKAYRTMFTAYRHSGSGATIVTATFRTSTGAATGGYYGAGWYVTYLATSGITGTRNNGTEMVVGSVFDTARMTRTFVDVSDVGVSGFYPSVTGAFYDFSQAQNVTFGYELANGTNVIDRIRFACAVNITGNWRVYGYKEP